MNKNKGISTPGGMPVALENPHSSESGSTDSGESQLLHLDPFKKCSRVNRSPPAGSNIINKRASTPMKTTASKTQVTKTSTNLHSSTHEEQALARFESLQKENAELRTRLADMEDLCIELRNELSQLRADKIENQKKAQLERIKKS